MFSSDFIGTFFRLFYYLLPYIAYQPEASYNFDKEYDYIIAGAGSAGSVLASRLSEDPYVKVLLLEAGGHTDPITEIPAAGYLFPLTDNHWNFISAPQQRSSGAFPNRQFPVPRGKGLGGSSLINFMLYVRCNKRDFDQWAEDGATGWSWNDVYPYFLKSEDNTDPEFVNDYHASGGLLTVSTPPETNAVKEAFNAGGQELGYEYRDINGEKQTGFAKIQGTLRDGRRCSTAKAFLVPAEDRDNLYIVNNAFVQKVLINNNKEAYGVRFEKEGDVYDIRARKEVIVSGGTINSPQILMLSGIGLKEHLQDLGIKVIADLPVGDNLQNHVGNVVLNFEAKHAAPIMWKEASLPSSLLKYKVHGTGPETSLSAIEGMALINSKYNDANLDWPDLQIHLISGSPASDGSQTLKKGFLISDEVYDKVYKPYVGKNSFTFLPDILRPKSRGTIRLLSDDPYKDPLIDFNLFQNGDDLDVLVDALKQCVNLVSNTTAFKNIGAKMFDIKLPGCEQYEIYSDDYLRCIATEYALNAYHPVGSCKMGDAADETTVVDPELKVKGIKNLRVVDGSIIPRALTGNINAPIIMIAEKASDMIKNDYPDRIKCFV